MTRATPTPPLFPHPPLFRSIDLRGPSRHHGQQQLRHLHAGRRRPLELQRRQHADGDPAAGRRPIAHRQLHRGLLRRHPPPPHHRHHHRHQRPPGEHLPHPPLLHFAPP